jgi:hypothetical protein
VSRPARCGSFPGDTGNVDRERAETYLRLLAEAELRCATTIAADNDPGWWRSVRLELAAEALSAVGAVGADVADAIMADVGLAVAGRYRLSMAGPGWRLPAPLPPPRASCRVVPVGQVIKIRHDDLRGELLVVAYAQSAGGARLIVLGGPFRPTAAADDQGASYQITYSGGYTESQLLLRPGPPQQIRWLDLTTAGGEPATTRIDLGPRIRRPDVSVTPNAHSPGELLLEVIAAQILSTVAYRPPDNPGPLTASAHLRAFIGDGPGHIVAALHAAGALPPDSPVPGQLAGLCARLGIGGHGITTPPDGDLPEQWHSMLTPPRRREPQPPAVPRILAATVAELPEPDGAKIAIVGLTHGLTHGLHAGEPRTIMHLLASGIALEHNWKFTREVRPLPVLWIRDSDGRWHTIRTDSAGPWSDTGAVMVWLEIVPPLERGTAWIEISAAGPSAQARITLPLSSR